MKTCLFCGKILKSKWQKKFCNVSCQNRFQNPLRRKKIITIDCICLKCGAGFKQNIKENSTGNYIKKYCSLKCANARILTKEIKEKISSTLKGRPSRQKAEKVKRCCELKSCNKEFEVMKYSKKRFCSIICRGRAAGVERVKKYCKLQSCNKEFESLKTRNRKFCSLKCSQTYIGSIGGRASAAKLYKRSKNEIHFYELCNKKYSNVTSNEPIFNGWDADVILKDQKIAVLWNGKWHYEKIKRSHSVKQVQNRDRIKINEIIKAGYIPYVIKDMGKYNPVFVEQEFVKFERYIAS